MKVRTPPYTYPGIEFDPESNMTKQAMKAECDINKIMAKYQKTGIINHVASYGAEYGDYYAVDFQEAQEILKSGQEMFDALPSSVRKRFENDPAQFMSFCADPANKNEMAEYGLLNPDYKPEFPLENDVPRGTSPKTPPKEEPTS